ncbi:putative MRPL23-mitochondrial ribosomal protein, large subunit [Catenaria anguillulae PL171]|uniref:Putative MRPL23-mitochondrial ribosomal protein, large subunit n=1 Tax=Catenaria anguillulae PL171 TaxID=765915 RepID=A0A1Y2HLG5_9FUNG|nr:putative MRPL23-mitochondrial ribosomal protein, large subunit [Catenaria anguillulae PL171]
MSQAIGQTSLAYARVWHHLSASNQVLGRLAPQIAHLLMGKHKPIYDPASDCGDYVVVTSAANVRVTGAKAHQKLYRYHTGHHGGLKEIPYAKMMDSKPDQIIRNAVKGMLPKNRLRDDRLARLLVFPGKDHPYQANIKRSYVAKAMYVPVVPLQSSAAEAEKRVE